MNMISFDRIRMLKFTREDHELQLLCRMYLRQVSDEFHLDFEKNNKRRLKVNMNLHC